MSALEGKEDTSTTANSENILPPDKSAKTKTTTDVENTTNPSELGVEVSKEDENDGNLVSLDSGTVEKGIIVDTNLKSDTFVEGDKIIDKPALIATKLSKTTSLEVPSSSIATVDDPNITFENKTSDTNEYKTQENVPKDTTPDIELDKTKDSVNLVGNDNNPFDDLNDSFEDDLELKWEDDEKDEEYSTNLSEEALKSLDKELGIDEIGETNTDMADDINKQNKDTEENLQKLIVEGSTQSGINKHIGKAEEIAENVTENINIVGLCTTTDTKQTGLDENKDIESSTIPESVEEDNKMEIVDNPKEIPKKSNIPEGDSQIKIDITTAIKESNDVPLKVIDSQEKTLLRDCTDIEMTEITDQSLQEVDSSDHNKENPLLTKNDKDIGKQEVSVTNISEVGKLVTDVNDKNTVTEVSTTELNENEVTSVTKGMKTDLGLNKPDVMLEIPTQELIDIDEFDDSSVMNKEIIDSEVNTTSTPESKASLEENIEKNDKYVKLTTEQQKTTSQFEEKDVTVTELVKIVTEKEQSEENTKKLRGNIMEIDENYIPSDENVKVINSTVNEDKITGESSSKVSNDNLTAEPIVKTDDDVSKESISITTDSNLTLEPMSIDNTIAPITEASDDNMKVESIDVHMTEDQSSKANETSNIDDIMIAKVSEENLTITESTSKNDDNIAKEISVLDKIMTSEPISKSNDTNMTENNEKTKKKSPVNENIKAGDSKNTQEASKQDSKIPKLDENKSEPTSEAIGDNMTKESSIDVTMAVEISNDKEEASKLDENTKIESISKPNITKKSPVDDSMTAELPKDNPNTTETTSKGDDDMAEDPEISDSLGLLAESSRVMDDDDQDEDDDSDDFDQDDESSNLQTAEHSEESNPPSDEAQRDDKDIPIPEDSVLEGDGIIYSEDTNTGLDIVDDIVCDETDIVEKVGATIESEIKSATLGDEISPEESIAKEIEESTDTSKKDDGCVLRKLLLKDNKQDEESEKSPSKSKKLSINNINAANVMTYVDLEESSDDDIQEINKIKSEEKKDESDDVTEEKNIEESKPKPTLKMTKLNTSEVTIKTGLSSIPPLIIPEITNVSEIEKAKDNVAVEKRNLEEVFNLDSDSEGEDVKKPEETIVQTKFNPKCINAMCTSPSTDQHYVADAAAMRHYGATKRRAICAPCLASVDTRNEALIKGIKDLTPLLELNMEKPTNQLVEISDSESDDESDLIKECNELIGLEGAKMLNEKLADLINETWQKFNMDDRLKDSENYINEELKRLEDEGTEINKLLDECQTETDTIRNELYKTFERSSKSLPPLAIHDTPTVNYVCLEKDDTHQHIGSPFLRSALEEPPAKRQNRGLTQTNTEVPANTEALKQSDDDRDVSVVLLSAESAPEDLPPPGEVVRPPLRVGMSVHAMRNAFGSWLRGKILDIQNKVPGQPYTNCRVKFDHNVKNPCKVLPARCIAYQEPCSVRMTIGTRVLALFKDSNRKESFYSGVVAEIPNPVNSYRYLVFFDDGYAQYVRHKDTRLVCESKSTVWEEVHPFIRDFVKDYLMKYPERPMVRLHAGQRLNTEWNGKWWTSRVLQVDASLAHVHFEEDDRTEWIYRGSTRLAPLYLELQAAGRSRTRLPRSKAQFRTNMPYVEYMRSEEQTKQQQQLQQEEMIRRQRAVAKKSVSLPQPTPMVDKPDSVTSRVVYYTPKNAVKPYRMVPHTCGPSCRRTDVLSLKELRTYNPLAKPLLSGWERMQVRFKGSKHIMYRAPCGRRIRDMKELHRYLRAIDSDLPVDLFDFNVNTHCLAEFVLHKYNVMKKDLSHGKESVPVPCVNYYDDSLPEFCSYNTERTPTAGVPLNLDPDFLCGCDCTDDCEDKSKCACWKMTLEGARTIGLDSPNVGYVYRRLPEPLPSGIYECNSRCKCKSTCLNRVAQHPLQLKLQVFKTLKRGWGIRALNDVPKGSFLCVYAGNLLTDATANLDGLNEGDEYLAELDYIEVVEQMKEGFEEDIPEADQKLDKKESKQSTSEDEETESDEDDKNSDKDDNDFQPGFIGLGLTEFNKRLRKRCKKKQNETEDNKEKGTEERKTDDCITISDDEEVREPSRFTAQAGMGDKGFISKYRSVRTLFGKDEACYIMDAKVQGNIGRYLNHSCCPNVFVQNVFVDTHDPRFPWVAFFALSHIRAGTELTWNYNYDIGSVPGKILYCYCGAHNCRGRLL